MVPEVTPEESAPKGEGAATNPPSDQDNLGDKGKRAIEAMKAERDAATAAAKPWKSLGVTPEEVKELLSSREGEAERQKAREIQQQALKTVGEKLLKAEIKAAAKGLLADPQDAHLFIDMTKLEIGDDLSVDADAIADAIKELVDKKPYLAANSEKKFGSADLGRQGGNELSLDQKIAEAEKAGDVKRAIALKNSKLFKKST